MKSSEKESEEKEKNVEITTLKDDTELAEIKDKMENSEKESKKKEKDNE